ncbi:aldose 1-epimerase family protein [Aurantibacillus circumpalustris]|uniref:aldose 1-epimerase family protein n=1 Tax=Aurantibacillus circumpalustris TaxID=3036359 RepID=UPI00295C0217|nr:aldose 1-epimerase family protein [Aurantibacillus circumpalustris]
MDIILSSNKLKVVLKSLGAEICSVKNKDDLEFMWQAKKEFWPRHAPVLFPIVGQLKEDTFIFENKPYKLSKHGFARDCEFTLVENSGTTCTFQLQSDLKTKTVYPFDFIFEIKYELVESVLTTDYKVINPSSEPIYFSVGGHPAFACPLNDSEVFEDYYFEFASKQLEVTELNKGLRKETKQTVKLKENKLFLSETLFDNDALIFENNQVNKISLCSSKSTHKITLECKNWPYFGVWSKERCKEYVCMEPWHGIADLESSNKNLTEKEGIIKLEPEKQFNCSFSISFE